MSFGRYVFDQSPAKYSDKVLLIDDEHLKRKENIDAEFRQNGFEIVDYTDDLSFRIEHEADLKTEGKKMAIFTETSKYVPYDLLKRMKAYIVTMQKLFAEIEVGAVEGMNRTHLDLLVQAYTKGFVKSFDKQKTTAFIKNQVFSKENIGDYLADLGRDLEILVLTAKTPRDWFGIAELKAKIDVLSVQNQIITDTNFVNHSFKDYCMKQFGSLSTKLDRESPVLSNRAMEYMHDHSEKYAVIVMDGTSEFDWESLSKSFKDIKYHKTSLMAIIPSTTSVSCQCLLGGKLPQKLENPWKQDKEKKEFITCAKDLGFQDNQISYERGYDTQFGAFVRCGAVIIMDVDEMVHSQKQRKVGMAQDISLLAKQKKLSGLTKRLLSEGFDVYITADHGNTTCTGMGYVKGTGVEVETKSRRFLVLKDFADKTSGEI